MSNFFDKFPKTSYNIGKSTDTPNNLDSATNILVRVRVLVEKLDQVFHYYEYVIKEGETPEILAEKYYGDSEAHWLVLMTNNITDAQYDWPLGYDAFNKYMINKYGSIQNAQTTIHHYERIRKVVDNISGDETLSITKIATNPVSNITIGNAGRGYTANANAYLTISDAYGTGANIGYTTNANGSIISLTINGGGGYIGAPNVYVSGSNTDMALLYTYVATGNTWTSLPTESGSPIISQTIGTTSVSIYDFYRNSITNYDYELELNEKKRNIKLVKKDYYPVIIGQFNSIMDSASVTKTRNRGLRTIR